MGFERMTPGIHPTGLARRLGIIACEVALLGTLGACSAEDIELSNANRETATLVQTDAASTENATQLINDGTSSLSNVLQTQNRDPSKPVVTLFEALEEHQALNLAAATPDQILTAVPEIVPEVVPQATFFQSARTPGFTGQLLSNGTVQINWIVDPTARGYNVYRQAKYITTVFVNEYIDDDIFDGNLYYEIQAFDHETRFSYVAKGLTVRVSGSGQADPNQAPTNATLLNDYALIFEDDFNGSTLDTSKWNTQFIWGPDLIINQEEQYYVDIVNDPNFGFDPFTFDGQSLTINTIPTPDSLRVKANDQPYLSGIITSRDALKLTYGYVETRARVPYGRGYWPAFWLLNAYYDVGGDWPEIDIMEFIGSDEDVVYHTYHYYDENHVLRSTQSQPTPGIDYTLDFHTFGVEWTPGELVYYVDGRIVHRVNNPQVSSEEMYLIANTAVGGWWAGSPDQKTPFPGKYELDYIRVYQKTGLLDDRTFNDAIKLTPLRQNTGQESPGHRPPFNHPLNLP